MAKHTYNVIEKIVSTLEKVGVLEPPKEVLVTISCLKGQVSFVK